MRKIILYFYSFILMLGGCDLGLEENNSDFYRYSIIVESDLPEIHINQTNLDSKIVYPCFVNILIYKSFNFVSSSIR